MSQVSIFQTTSSIKQSLKANNLDVAIVDWDMKAEAQVFIFHDGQFVDLFAHNSSVTLPLYITKKVSNAFNHFSSVKDQVKTFFSRFIMCASPSDDGLRELTTNIDENAKCYLCTYFSLDRTWEIKVCE